VFDGLAAGQKTASSASTSSIFFDDFVTSSRMPLIDSQALPCARFLTISKIC
jgi:hypothetical protein